MRTFVAIAVVLVMSSVSAAQAPAGKQRKLAVATHAIARETRQTFTDMRHDPLWAVFVVGTIALNFADLGTTCKFRSLGIAESNPLLPSHGSCAQYTSITIAATTVQLVGTHYIRGWFTQKCRDDAADPNSLWNSGKIDAATYNPETCKYGVDAAGMMFWPLHARVIANNIDQIHEQERINAMATGKPNLRNVVLVRH